MSTLLVACLLRSKTSTELSVQTMPDRVAQFAFWKEGKRSAEAALQPRRSRFTERRLRLNYTPGALCKDRLPNSVAPGGSLIEASPSSMFSVTSNRRAMLIQCFFFFALLCQFSFSAFVAETAALCPL